LKNNKEFTMEDLKIFESRLARRAAAVVVGVLALAGCAEGKADTPSVEDIRDRGEFVEMQRPDGTEMMCLYFGDRGASGHQGYSWLVMDCDWGNEYPSATEQIEAEG
jgi:hypothetical protein